MQPANSVAFKEWAAVCLALAEGRQALILRKGGIHEGRAGFRVAHGEFWLFPTYLHEAAGGLIPEAAPLLDRAIAERPEPGTLTIAHYAVVSDVFEIRDEARLPKLAGEHVWSPETVTQRFHYRQPGLFALVVRVYRSARTIVIPDLPHFAGCRSWVDLPTEMPTAGMTAALDDAAFEQRRSAIARALTDAVV